MYTEPEFEHSALISIDVQCDFVDGGSCPIAGTSAAIPQMAMVARGYRAAGLPIVHMVRIYKPDGSNADISRRAALEDGAQIVLPSSAGVELAAGLLAEGSPGLDCELLLSGEAQALGPAEWAMFKPRWGAFFGTSLEAMLQRLAITTLVFCGCNFPNCPRTSIYEASERDFRIVLAEDAISGLYARGRDELEAIGVAMMPAANIATRCGAGNSARRRVSTRRSRA
jgi:nicotinamidase-related amidase